MPNRYEVPPPGPSLAFLDWALLITSGVRRYLPAVKAARRGRDRVILRYAGSAVTLIDDRGIFAIRLGADAKMLAQTSLFDAHRHDAYTAANFAKTIAGHFDSQFSLTENTSTP